MIVLLFETAAMSVLALTTGVLAVKEGAEEGYFWGVLFVLVAVMAAWLAPSPLNFATMGGPAVQP